MDVIKTFWHVYQTQRPDGDPTRPPCPAGRFGDSAEMADDLGDLILQGVKTATCSALWEWEAEEEPLPIVGEEYIVLDGRDVPLCIIETTEVTIRPYNEVDAGFAYEEGEGDRSLDYWRTAHWCFFARTLPNIGKTPSETMPLVCERFRVVYRPET